VTKKSILLINLGTPAGCDRLSVRRYLKEFLHDPRVIDLPFYIRWPFVNLFLVPFRYKKSARAYQKIWQETGSPLLINSHQFKNALALELGSDYQVELSMRYGEPNIASAYAKLKDTDSLTVVPLFPQYSSAATGSAIEKLLAVLSKEWNVPQIIIKKSFYDHPAYISAYAEMIQKNLSGKNVDLILFSYHGLPDRHINKSECEAACDRTLGCPAIDKNNLFCYRAQCHATSHLIAKALGLNLSQYTISFQSRLGRTPWITPYTDLLLPELSRKGIKDIAIVCPSFVVDCLETLEEVNIRTREQWMKLGGNDFIFIPCINNSPIWVKGLADTLRS
jgi:protoporphyrin/coproporphyrin ferrochelatase